jgi:hypothetical protein
MRPQRRYDLDWLRVFVVLHLIPYHIAAFMGHLNMTNASGGRLSRAILLFPAVFANPWHMHIMFFISGAVTCYALRFRSIQGYVLNRLKRLLVPLLFSGLVILPVHHFYWRFPPLSPLVEESHYQDIFTFFLKDYFKLLWMDGTFFLGNLWFVYYLLVFSLLCLPLFVYLGGDHGRRLTARLAHIFEKPGAILSLGVPLAVGIVVLTIAQRGRMAWNIVDDLTRSFQYITCFVYGYLISSDERFWETIEKHWKISGIMLAAMNVVFMMFAPGEGPPGPGIKGEFGHVIVAGLRGFNTWLWMLLILGLGRKLLNFENRFLRYTREAFYPFFIIHQPLMLAIGHYMYGWRAPILVQALVVGVLTSAGMVLLYELCVRRTNITRFLFGLRPKEGLSGVRPSS